MLERSDYVNLGQGVYEEAYKKIFIQKQPRCGVHSKKEAEVVVDDILINRMDEIREVLARIDQRKECQE